MKLAVAILIDAFDFTVGRVLFATPFAGEVIGCAIGYAVYGPRALFYALEAIDITEQGDAVVPLMTIIAMSVKREAREAEAARPPDIEPPRRYDFTPLRPREAERPPAILHERRR